MNNTKTKHDNPENRHELHEFTLIEKASPWQSFAIGLRTLLCPRTGTLRAERGRPRPQQRSEPTGHNQQRTRFSHEFNPTASGRKAEDWRPATVIRDTRITPKLQPTPVKSSQV